MQTSSPDSKQPLKPPLEKLPLSVAVKNFGWKLDKMFWAGAFFTCLAIASFTGIAMALLNVFSLSQFAALTAALILATWILFIKSNVKQGSVTARAISFAQSNDFVYKETDKQTKYSGIIFKANDGAVARNIISGVYAQQKFTIFNYGHAVNTSLTEEMETEEVDTSKEIVPRGVVVVDLPAHLPNVLFDSHTTKVKDSALVAGLKKNQRLQLEGNFNKHFDVYTPSDYKRDALYFVTPELMEILIQKATNYDIEVVDNKLIFYGQSFEFTSAELTSVFEVLERVASEFYENTARYKDERTTSGNLQVAAQGRRLTRGLKISLSGISIGALMLALYLLSLS